MIEHIFVCISLYVIICIYNIVNRNRVFQWAFLGLVLNYSHCFLSGLGPCTEPPAVEVGPLLKTASCSPYFTVLLDRCLMDIYSTSQHSSYDRENKNTCLFIQNYLSKHHSTTQIQICNRELNYLFHMLHPLLRTAPHTLHSNHHKCHIIQIIPSLYTTVFVEKIHQISIHP